MTPSAAPAAALPQTQRPWDLVGSAEPSSTTCAFRSRRTVLVWPSWASDIPGAYAELRARWCSTRSPILQSQCSAGKPVHGHDELVPHRPWFLKVLTALADSLSPAPVRIGGGVRIPVWEYDTVTAHLRQGDLLVGEGRTTAYHAHDSDPLRRVDADSLELREQCLVNPVCGAVGLGVEQRLDWETTAPVAGQTPLWDGRRIRPLTWSGQEPTFERSRRAALLEALERLAGARQRTGQVVISAEEDLTREHRVPDNFGAYGPGGYVEGIVPFSPDMPHEWVVANSLKDGREVLVPRDLAFFAQPLLTPRWSFVCTSGLATGSSVEEACLFGLLELVERDAFINCWVARVGGRRIDPRSVPGTRTVLSRAALLGHRVDVLAIPSDTGVPVIAAVARGSRAAAFWAAAHPDPERAVISALSEAWTYLPEREERTVRERQRCLDMLRDPTLVTGIDDHPLQCIFPEAKPLVQDYVGDGPVLPLKEVFPEAPLAGLGALGLLNELVSRLGRIGVDPLVVRATTPLEGVLGLETCSVLTPGLSPLDFGWHRQRVLQMRRPSEFCRNLGMPEPATLRRHPHPFS